MSAPYRTARRGDRRMSMKKKYGFDFLSASTPGVLCALYLAIKKTIGGPL
jgi:hypothetical protein